MRTSPTSKPQIFLAMGDPAGIGPEVILKALANPETRELAVFVVVGDKAVFRGLSGGLFDKIPVKTIERGASSACKPSRCSRDSS